MKRYFYTFLRYILVVGLIALPSFLMHKDEFIASGGLWLIAIGSLKYPILDGFAGFIKDKRRNAFAKWLYIVTYVVAVPVEALAVYQSTLDGNNYSILGLVSTLPLIFIAVISVMVGYTLGMAKENK